MRSRYRALSAKSCRALKAKSHSGAARSKAALELLRETPRFKDLLADLPSPRMARCRTRHCPAVMQAYAQVTRWMKVEWAFWDQVFETAFAFAARAPLPPFRDWSPSAADHRGEMAEMPSARRMAARRFRACLPTRRYAREATEDDDGETGQTLLTASNK